MVQFLEAACSKSKQPRAFLTGTFDVERSTVGLPLKKNHPPLVDNYNQAVQRLVAVERNLKMAQYVRVSLSPDPDKLSNLLKVLGIS